MTNQRFSDVLGPLALLFLVTILGVVPVAAKESRRTKIDLSETVYNDPDSEMMRRILFHEHGKIHTLRFSSGTTTSPEVIDLARRVLLTHVDSLRELSFFMTSLNSIYLAQGEDSHFKLRQLLAWEEVDRKALSRDNVPEDNYLHVRWTIPNCQQEAWGTTVFHDYGGDPIDYQSDPNRFDAMKCNSLIAEYILYLDDVNMDATYNRRVDFRLKSASLRGFRDDGYAYNNNDTRNAKDWVYEFVDSYEFILDTDLLDKYRFSQEETYPRPTLEQCDASTTTSRSTGWSIGVDMSISAESGRKGKEVGAELGGSFTHSEETSESVSVSCDLSEFEIIADPGSNNNHFSIVHDLAKLGKGEYSRSWSKSLPYPETYAMLCDSGVNHAPSDVNCHGSARGSGCEGDYGPNCCEYQNDKGDDFCELSTYNTLPNTVTSDQGYGGAGAYISLVGAYAPDLVAEDTLRAKIKMGYNQGFRAWHQATNEREMWKRNWETYDIKDVVVHFPDVVIDWSDQRLFSLKTLSLTNFATRNLVSDVDGSVALLPEGSIDEDYARPVPLENDHVFYPYQVGGKFFDAFQIRRYDTQGNKWCLGLETSSLTLAIVDCSAPGAYFLNWEVQDTSTGLASDQVCSTQDPQNACLIDLGGIMGIAPACAGGAGCDPQRWTVADPLTDVTYCSYLTLQYGTDCYG